MLRRKADNTEQKVALRGGDQAPFAFVIPRTFKEYDICLQHATPEQMKHRFEYVWNHSAPIATPPKLQRPSRERFFDRTDAKRLDFGKCSAASFSEKSLPEPTSISLGAK
jgi:hypothetical protein